MFLCRCVADYAFDDAFDFDVPLQNGGTCKDGVADFSCTCDEGFSGKLCDRRESICQNSKCPLNTLCVTFKDAGIRFGTSFAHRRNYVVYQ